MIKKLRNNKGFNIIGLMVMSASILVGAVSVISVLMTQRKMQAEISFKGNIQKSRNYLLNSISSDASWARIKAQNPRMNCTSSLQAYCSGNTHEKLSIAVYGGDGALIYDARQAANGFRFDGGACHDFSAAGNDACPVHVDVQWRGECANAGCSTQIDFVDIRYIYKPGSNDKTFPFREATYNIYDLNRKALEANENLILECSRQGKIFIGYQQVFNSHAADESGCVPYQTFVGADGREGDKGVDGPQGPMGPAGPPGDSAYAPSN